MWQIKDTALTKDSIHLINGQLEISLSKSDYEILEEHKAREEKLNPTEEVYYIAPADTNTNQQ